MSIFKERKVPKHLIIHDEYDFRRRSRFNFMKVVFWGLLMVSLTYVLILTRT